MADGTLSMMEGLGYKAQDSNEIRRKQKYISDVMSSIQLQQTFTENPRNDKSVLLVSPCSIISNEVQQSSTPGMVSPKRSIPYALVPPGSSFSTDVDLSSSDLQSASHGFGAHSPKSSKNSSPARKLQQVFFEEGLKLDAEVRATQTNPKISKPIELGNSRSNIPSEFNRCSTSTSTALGVQSPNSLQNPSYIRTQQQALFEEQLLLEAAERAQRDILQEQQRQKDIAQGGSLQSLPLHIAVANCITVILRHKLSFKAETLAP